jgi:muramoyltetrapeptide carboxypeptidase LdcA involved in peptidoglycan recycling
VAKTNHLGRAILFLETLEEMPSSKQIKYWLRNYAAQGILKKLSGIMVGMPYKNYSTDTIENYDHVILQVVRDENALTEIPIITQMDFGHTDPSFIISYGLMAEIDCDYRRFSIIENACI